MEHRVLLFFATFIFEHFQPLFAGKRRWEGGNKTFPNVRKGCESELF